MGYLAYLTVVLLWTLKGQKGRGQLPAHYSLPAAAAVLLKELLVKLPGPAAAAALPVAGMGKPSLARVAPKPKAAQPAQILPL